MRAVLEQIEFSWWSFHIRLLDESEVVRSLLPQIKYVLKYRRKIWTALAWAALGFPIGLLLGWLGTLIQ